ncbi:N-acetyltransferase B complex non catalytic subunit-domain-containing protein [Polychytrium aggregatum]|uniref:N-acetyltransferase B complex non catalytic subunit-domain-containing protein n=1 Tax=Polychytrium aggregatum TaxID=110093 RepID=UPI0022FDF20E|nr:N-acetyltransferase B complex non catalytic subunit-domain-containing protein [Polychytrium aggregatum]KAI9208961.1 N-acetyltransferase B complex non catalytic subunit-domain-containing protein [Polychytrium aggregatum]
MSQFTDVHESVLYPIYDAFDSGNPKQAHQLCLKALKKKPNALILKGLKAIALDRLGKPEEAYEACEDIKKAGVTDEAVLQTALMVYRSQNKNQDILELYEKAAQLDPRNEELANHWYMAIVRCNDPKSQQQAALKLHKQFKKDKYQLWAIMCLYLQAPQNPLLYSLAERMAERALQEKKIKDYEGLQLYTMILTAQNKHQEAAALVQGPAGALCKVASERKRLEVELLKPLGDWKRIYTLSRELLTENIDDWGCYLDMVEYAAHVKQQDDTSQASSVAAEVLEFIKQQQTVASKAKRTPRGPYLAELAYHHRLLADLGASGSSKIQELVLEYFQRFGSTQAFFEDVCPYIGSVDSSDRPAFVQGLEQAIQPGGKPIDAIKQRVNLKKIENNLAVHDTVEAKLEFVNQLASLYQDTLPHGVDLKETENQYGDDFLVLAAHVLIDLFTANREAFGFLFRAISLLECGLLASKFNFQMKLLLVRLYREVGAIERCMEVATNLNVKQIQNDTISYFFTDDIETLGTYSQAMPALLRGATIYTSNERETPEMIVKAYQFGTFSKIPEFLKFQDRLANSLQRRIFKLQTLRVELIRRSLDCEELASVLEEVTGELPTTEEIARLSDNRDKTLMSNWSNLQGSISSHLADEPVPRPRESWIKLYSAVLWILKSMVTANVDAVAASIPALAECVARKPELVISEESSAEILLKATKIFQQVASGIEDDALEGSIESAFSQIDEMLALLRTRFDYPVVTGESLTLTSLVLEALNYVAIVHSSLVNVHKAKKGKAKPQQPKGLAQLKEKLGVRIKSLTAIMDGAKKETKKRDAATLADLFFEANPEKDFKNMNGVYTKIVSETPKSYISFFEHIVKEAKRRI